MLISCNDSYSSMLGDLNNNFIEIGPAKVLTGMVRKTLKDVKVSAISTVEDLEKVISEYKVEV